MDVLGHCLVYPKKQVLILSCNHAIYAAFQRNLSDAIQHIVNIVNIFEIHFVENYYVNRKLYLLNLFSSFSLLVSVCFYVIFLHNRNISLV